MADANVLVAKTWGLVSGECDGGARGQTIHLIEPSLTRGRFDLRIGCPGRSQNSEDSSARTTPGGTGWTNYVLSYPVVPGPAMKHRMALAWSSGRVVTCSANVEYGSLGPT